MENARSEEKGEKEKEREKRGRGRRDLVGGADEKKREMMVQLGPAVTQRRPAGEVRKERKNEAPDTL